MPILTLAQLKAKSAAKISTLQEPLKTAASLLVERCYARGIMIIITEALRTYEYQDYLYSKGRTLKYENGRKLEIVTNARGGYSNHNFGFSFDFALLLPNGKTIVWDTDRSDNLDSLPDWSEVVIEGKRLGLEWGGDWRKFVDMPHFQMIFGLTTAQFRAGKRPSQAQVNAALDKMKPQAVTPEPVKVEEAVTTAYPFVVGGKKAGSPAMVYGNTGVSYVPMRDLAEFIGVPFIWDNEEKKAYFNATEKEVAAGSKPPLQDVKLIDGRVYVQLRPLATAYGKKVEFKDKEVRIA